MNIFRKAIYGLRRFIMCLKCPLDPEECGYTNKIQSNGNCTKEKKEE